MAFIRVVLNGGDSLQGVWKNNLEFLVHGTIPLGRIHSWFVPTPEVHGD
jgi:hypothetical protein